jgi:hypothetical protein
MSVDEPDLGVMAATVGSRLFRFRFDLGCIASLLWLLSMTSASDSVKA